MARIDSSPAGPPSQKAISPQEAEATHAVAHAKARRRIGVLAIERGDPHLIQWNERWIDEFGHVADTRNAVRGTRRGDQCMYLAAAVLGPEA